MSKGESNNMDKNNVKKEKISQSVTEFVENNRELLDNLDEFRMKNNCCKFVNVEKEKMLYKYLSDTKILIITANEIEKTSLFAYAYKHNRTPFIQIGLENTVYTFFAFSSMVVAHVEINAGSYSHGGSSDVIKRVLSEAKPNIVILLGVAFGCNPAKMELGDVLVGRQHFSYDKSSKISEENLSIKKLHVEEPDEYMLNRFKALITTEDKIDSDFNRPFQVFFGNMITGEFVVDSIDFREMIFKPFEAFGVVGGEMEAQGAFEEVRRHKKTHCILIKGICDWGAGKNEQIDDDNPKNKLQTLAALNACKICYQLLSEKNFYSDCRLKGFRKRFYSFCLGKLFKSNMIKLPYFIKYNNANLICENIDAIRKRNLSTESNNMMNNGKWIKYKPELKNELEDHGTYYVKLDNGEIKLVVFHRSDGRFHSNEIDGEIYIKTEEHIVEIKDAFKKT